MWYLEKGEELIQVDIERPSMEIEESWDNTNNCWTIKENKWNPIILKDIILEDDGSPINFIFKIGEIAERWEISDYKLEFSENTTTIHFSQIVYKNINN